jgi:hypothetical protein
MQVWLGGQQKRVLRCAQNDKFCGGAEKGQKRVLRCAQNDKQLWWGGEKAEAGSSLRSG